MATKTPKTKTKGTPRGTRIKAEAFPFGANRKPKGGKKRKPVGGGSI